MSSRVPCLAGGALLLAVTVLFTGCGQKGPLYLPVTPPRTIPPMPTTRTPAATTQAALPATLPAPNTPPRSGA